MADSSLVEITLHGFTHKLVYRNPCSFEIISERITKSISESEHESLANYFEVRDLDSSAVMSSSKGLELGSVPSEILKCFIEVLEDASSVLLELAAFVQILFVLEGE